MHQDVDTDLVEYLIVTVPRVDALAALAPAIAQLVSSAQVRILDLVCVAPTPNGGHELVPLELEDVSSLAELSRVEGEFGGFLSEGDMKIAALSVPPASASLLLLVEDLGLAPLSRAAHDCGGRILGGERIPRSRVLAALADPSETLTTDDRPENGS